MEKTWTIKEGKIVKLKEDSGQKNWQGFIEHMLDTGTGNSRHWAEIKKFQQLSAEPSTDEDGQEVVIVKANVEFLVIKSDD